MLGTSWLRTIKRGLLAGYKTGAAVGGAVGTVGRVAFEGVSVGAGLTKAAINNMGSIKRVALPLALGVGVTHGALTSSEAHKAGPMDVAPIRGSAIYTTTSGIRDLGADGSLVLASSKRRNG
jgi:hypothetical protein